MNIHMQAGVLNQKLDNIQKLGDLKYATSRDLFDLTTKINVQEETIKGLEKRFNDYITSQRYMKATNISSLSLIIAFFALIAHYFK